MLIFDNIATVHNCAQKLWLSDTKAFLNRASAQFLDGLMGILPRTGKLLLMDGAAGGSNEIRAAEVCCGEMAYTHGISATTV
ncbi:hypothetical protein ACLOJK_017466 [Asimina triloba]